MLDDRVTVLNGIGEKRALLLEKLGIKTVRDLLYYFPRTYEDRTKISTIYDSINGETVCIKATVFSDVSEKIPRKGLKIYSAVVSDGTGVLTAVWFNNKYIKSNIKKGETYVFYGKIKKESRFSQIENPVFELADNLNKTRKIVPVYPLIAELTQSIFFQSVQSALKAIDEIEDYMPCDILKKYELCDLKTAVYNIHFPESFEKFEDARRRLVFDEFFVLSLTLAKIKTTNVVSWSVSFKNISCINDFVKSLPYTLTSGQLKVIREIGLDLSSNVPMNRLVQGDVGSGKTVVSAAAIYCAAENGFQASLMAPTEILAVQHYNNFVKMFGSKFKICLLSGGMSAAKKREAYELIKSGEAQIIIGTHALIQSDVEYKNLALVVTDEQHRFGVTQREALAKKGINTNVLVMSATPIPRTLALILYGDMDISVIDTMPKGRLSVKTYSVDESMRARINNFIKKNIDDGRQAYIVCPLVEESEATDLKNVTEYTKKLSSVFPSYKISLIHGKLKPAEKDEIMQQFKNGEIDILVSTTVIEVGVDVSNANLMIIENAERFGLSTLHQLRGRVGRGEYQSYCILFNQSDSQTSRKRMNIMCSSNDGFYISEQDLLLRGSGDFFGVKQHGLPPFKIANLFCDRAILSEAQEATRFILNEDKNSSDVIKNEKLNKIVSTKLKSLFL